MNVIYFASTAVKSTLVAALILALLGIGYIGSEPIIGHSASDIFTVSQTVTGEISFVASTTDVTMSPSIAGLTGGTSNGATQVIVTTNDNAGYNMTINFDDLGMVGVAGGTIDAFATTTTQEQAEPNYDFGTSEVPANHTAFGYSVEATTTTDLDPSFLDDGAGCNTGSADASNQCWMGASTTAFTVVNRASETPASGSTTTIKFRTIIRANPAPDVPEDTYYATSTLTALTN